MIPERDLIWPFKLFYQVTPFSYFIRSCIYEQFSDATFQPCPEAGLSVACTSESSSGIEVLKELGKVTDVFSTTSTTLVDISVLFAIGAFLKIMYILGVVHATTKTIAITSNRKQTMAVKIEEGTGGSSISSVERTDESNEEKKYCRIYI